MEQFECKTKIISGPGAVSALAELGAKRLFLVTDPYFAKNGTAERIAKMIRWHRIRLWPWRRRGQPG